MDLPTFTSITPDMWGRSFWEFLDAIVATFPKDCPNVEHRNAVYDLMHSLKFLLPCPDCRKHYVEFLSKNSLDNALISRKTFVDFYFLLKRDIANRTRKNFLIKNPNELFIGITRRLKLTKIGQNVVSQPLHHKPFRVPRVRVGTSASTKTKGCGCGK